jgi:hypothetical protein
MAAGDGRNTPTTLQQEAPASLDTNTGSGTSTPHTTQHLTSRPLSSSTPSFPSSHLSIHPHTPITNLTQNPIPHRQYSTDSKKITRLKGSQTIAYVNIEGLENPHKHELLKQFLQMTKPLLLAITESHIYDNEIIPDLGNDWTVINVGRQRHLQKKGGGILIAYQSHLTVKITNDSTELVWIDLKIGRRTLTLGIVYMATENTKSSPEYLNNLKLADQIRQKVHSSQLPTFVIGDFNGHIVPFHDVTNNNGQILTKLVDETNLRILNLEDYSEGTYTWQARGQKSVIDFILANDLGSDLVTKLYIDDVGTYDLLTDHSVMLFDLGNMRERNHRPTVTYTKKWKLNMTQQGDFFREQLTDRLRQIDNAELLTTDDLNDKLTDAIIKTGEQCMGYKRTCNKDRPWYNKEIRKAITERKRLNRIHRRLNKDGAPREQIQDAWQKYQEQKKTVQRLVSQRAGEHDKQLFSKIQQTGGPSSKILWAHKKKLNKTNKDVTTEFSTNSGETLTNDEDITRHMTEFWTEMFQQQTEGRPPVRMTGLNSNEETLTDSPITMTELQSAIRSLPAGKATGPDNIPNEFIKHGGDTLHGLLLTLFNSILSTQKIPEAWKRTYLKLLHKGKGKPKNKLDSYRPIALISNLGKTFTKIIKTRLADLFDYKLTELQNGFRKDRRTTDHLFTLAQTILHHQQTKKPLYLAFIDIEKAYDKVDREILYSKLTELGLGQKDVQLFKDFYTNNKTKVKLQNWETEWIDADVGIKQGCNISPYLFLIYLLDLTEQLLTSNLGVKIGESTVPALFYADDIILLANDPQTLQDQLHILTRYGSDNNIKYSTSKCQIMAYNTDDKPALYLSDSLLDYTDDYTYLGVTFTTDKNIFKSHIQTTIKKSKRLEGLVRSIAHRSCNKPWVGRHLWKAVAVPALTYSNEVILYNKSDNIALDRAQNAVGKSILGGNWLTAHAAIAADLGWSDFTTREHKSKLKYHGRLLNQDDERLSAKANQNFITRWHSQIAKLYCRYEDPNNPFPRHIIKLREKAIKQSVATKYTQDWKDTLTSKTSLKLYRDMEAPSLKQIYDGTWGSELLFKARTNSWPLGYRTCKWDGTDGRCRQCNSGDIEDIIHLVIHCHKYTAERDQLMDKIQEKLDELHPNWHSLSDEEQTKILLGFYQQHPFIISSVKYFLTQTHTIRFPTYTRYNSF